MRAWPIISALSTSRINASFRRRVSHPKFALLRGPIPCYAAHCSKLEKKADLARMNARIQNKWEHCVARFVGQASHGVHMREPNTRIETICKPQSCMVLSETELAKVGQASHGVHMRDRLMLVRARSVHSYYSSGPSPAQSLVGDRVAIFACFLTGWPVLVPRHVVAGRVSFSLHVGADGAG